MSVKSILTGQASTDEKVTNILDTTTTKAYVTGTTSSTTNTGTQVFNTGIYLSPAAGELYADSLSTESIDLNNGVVISPSGNGEGVQIQDSQYGISIISYDYDDQTYSFGGTATSLETARTIQTNLGSTSSASFDGTANITPGITGTLAVGHGGTNKTSWTANKLIYPSASTTFTQLDFPTEDGSILCQDTSGAPYWTTYSDLSTSSFDWGDETADGDATWWQDLRIWVTSASADDLAECVGKTKSVTLTTAVLDTTTHLVRCIGYNCDGANTLTFQTANTLATTTTFGDSSAVWSESTARTLCQDYHNYFPGNTYIKTVLKGTNTEYNSSSVAYTNETVFLPSIHEMGLSSYTYAPTEGEYCYGYSTAYQYYSDNSSRIKYSSDSSTSTRSYWTRSRSTNTSIYVCYVYTSGAGYYNGYGISYGLAPAFVIG